MFRDIEHPVLHDEGLLAAVLWQASEQGTRTRLIDVRYRIRSSHSAMQLDRQMDFLGRRSFGWKTQTLHRDRLCDYAA